MEQARKSTRPFLYVINAPRFAGKKIEKSERPGKALHQTIAAIQEEERQKIGHELHDNTNSLLVIAKMYLKCLEANTEKEKIAKEEINNVLLTVIDNIRRVSAELVLSQRMDGTIKELVTELTGKINGINSMNIVFNYENCKELNEIDPQTKLTIYRVIQEQLNNTIKYSKAENVEISLLYKKGNIFLRIKDDGVGFDTSKPSQGIGLRNIENRVRKHEGTMNLKSAGGEGCCLEIKLPLDFSVS